MNLMSDFIEQGLDEFITPVTNLWTKSENFKLNDIPVTLTLISRRSRHRQGPRFVISYLSLFLIK
jgi:hypothetical protein